MSRTYKIAVLPGDGIGREVIPEAIRVFQTAIMKTGGIEIDLNEFATLVADGIIFLIFLINNLDGQSQYNR